MIHCIWYPSGGFGHFINAVISLHGKNFARPKKDLSFGANGHSHDLDLVAPKINQHTVKYDFIFDQSLNYTVLVDPTINNESMFFVDFFDQCKIIKICYSDTTWPIVAKTMIDKAMQSTVDQELIPESTAWSTSEDWATREKYFLFLRDHPLRKQWKPSSDTQCIWVDQLLSYQSICQALNNCGIECSDFEQIWQSWRQSNYKYLKPVLSSIQAVDDIRNGVSRPLTEFETLWDQAVFYYFLCESFGLEPLHNDWNQFDLTTDLVRKQYQR